MGEVRIETADGILTVTLADVENRDALGAEVLNGLHDAITEANALAHSQARNIHGQQGYQAEIQNNVPVE